LVLRYCMVRLPNLFRHFITQVSMNGNPAIEFPEQVQDNVVLLCERLLISMLKPVAVLF
jgi:hypothetical protein